MSKNEKTKVNLTEKQADFLSQIIASLVFEGANLTVEDEPWYPTAKAIKTLDSLYGKIPQSVNADWLNNWAISPFEPELDFDDLVGRTILCTETEGEFQASIRGVVRKVTCFPLQNDDGVWEIEIGSSDETLLTFDYDPNEETTNLEVLDD